MNRQESRRIHKCTIHISTKKGFRLTAAIEHMKIRGKRDERTRKWKCSDYIQFSLTPKNYFEKFLKTILDTGKSEKLCGEAHLNGSLVSGRSILATSTNANSFSTSFNEMSIFFHQDNDERGNSNNTFVIVVTSFRQANDEAACQGKHRCKDSPVTCISPDLVCDGHVNCAFPGSGSDELGCNDESPVIFNTTLSIILSLVGILVCVFIFCALISIICQMRKKKGLRQQRRAELERIGALAAEPTAPGFSNLPQYETVILADAESPKPHLNDDLPPSYDHLFPESPQTQKDAS